MGKYEQNGRAALASGHQRNPRAFDDWEWAIKPKVKRTALLCYELAARNATDGSGVLGDSTGLDVTHL